MYYPEKLPLHQKYLWRFENAPPHNSKLVKTYYHRISDILPIHTHDFYELNIIVTGSGRHYIGQRNVPTRSGDVFVIPPNIPHGYYSDGSLNVFHTLLSNSFLAMYSNQLAQLPGFKMLFEIEPTLRCMTESVFYLTLQNKPLDVCNRFISDIQSESAKADDGSNIRQSFFVLSLVSMLCEQITLSSHLLTEKVDSSTISIIKSIENIENSFQNKLSVEGLAKQCGLSYSTYIRLFKKLTGTTPLKYQQACRLKKAEELLDFSDENILSIALSCGYYDSAHFIREFTLHKGISPTRYRLNH